ncbi:DUF4007 family protein [Acinetobacter pittii]|uniref:DUF4007 family protein n=1 Tax=Acinetobacter pittii TaxID=48296 RepID=UPI002E1931D4|nr:DUF4007 family protein [Acinetobacter pittii]
MSKFPFPQHTKLMFSGHETFPLRQLWLKKAHHQILLAIDKDRISAPKSVFSDDDAIERFGVGKNMVAAIKHWALACDIIQDSDTEGGFEIGKIGEFLFGSYNSDAHDEFLERDASVWLIHWLLSGRSPRTPTLYAIFNFIQNHSFTQQEVLSVLDSSSAFTNSTKSKTTVSRDVETCIRSYTSSHDTEDNIDSLLSSLSLLTITGKGQYRFNQGIQDALPDEVFAFALLDFWSRWEQETGTSQMTLSFSSTAHWYGSPGRVFKLSEDAVADRLSRIAEITNNYLAWTDQAGIRQVTRLGKLPFEQAKMNILRGAYV